MNRLGMVFVVGALIVSLLLTLIIFSFKKSEPSPTKEVTILVAANKLEAGSTIQEGDVIWKKWPASKLSPLYIKQNESKQFEVVGAVVRSPIETGQPITDMMIISQGEMSPLARVLKHGYRAFTVDVNTAGAVAGFITPGDTVDVLVTFNAKPEAGTQDFYISKTILHSVTVIAVDQTVLVSGESNAGTVSSSKTSRSGADLKYVTLEVTPDQAEL